MKVCRERKPRMVENDDSYLFIQPSLWWKTWNMRRRQELEGIFVLRRL
jgi:hypothetical protein